MTHNYLWQSIPLDTMAVINVIVKQHPQTTHYQTNSSVVLRKIDIFFTKLSVGGRAISDTRAVTKAISSVFT